MLVLPLLFGIDCLLYSLCCRLLYKTYSNETLTPPPPPAPLTSNNHSHLLLFSLRHGDIVSLGSTYLFFVWDKFELKAKLDSKDEATRNSAITKITPFSVAYSTQAEKLVHDLHKKEYRHWKPIERMKEKLEAEAERASVVVSQAKEGTLEGKIDIEKIEDKLSLYETTVVQIEDYRRKHVKMSECKILEIHHCLLEANEIAEELEKFMEFELCLVSRGGPKKDVEVALVEKKEKLEKANNNKQYHSEEKKDESNSTSSTKEQREMKEIVDGLDMKALKITELETFPAEYWVRVKNTTSENPDELWHLHKFFNRLELMRDMWSVYLDSFKDLAKLLKARPPAVDPFYEPPKDVLVGVAYCFLDSLSYMVEIHESVVAINFKGKLVGELELDIYPMMDGFVKEEATKEGEVDFTSEEFVIAEHVGEVMSVSINIKSVKGIPRKTCTGVFVSFPFFLQTVPFATTRCMKSTVNPWFNETFSLQQVITEDFIDYLSHDALEIEIWGAPENAITAAEAYDQSMHAHYVIGEVIEIDLVAKADIQIDEDEADVNFLTEQLDEVTQELKVQKEVAKEEKALSLAAILKKEGELKELKEAKDKLERDIIAKTEKFEASKAAMEEDFAKKSKICVVS